MGDKRCSLMIQDDNFRDANDARLCIIGNVEKVLDNYEEATRLREVYLKRHPGASWIGFKDFNWYKFSMILGCKYVGGFASAHTCTSEEILNAKPDPHLEYRQAWMDHMNVDHVQNLEDIIWHQCAGMVVTDAQMVSLDYLGFDVKAKVLVGNGGYTKVRIPW